MNEVWLEIPDFPGYEVSNAGTIRNISRQTILAERINNRGHPMVTMYRENIPYTRMVSKVVASTFLPTENRTWSPFHLDRDLTNNATDNLEWRPRWFLHKHAIEAKSLTYILSTRPVECVTTGVRYSNIHEAACDIGGLDSGVARSAQYYPNSWHMGYQFRFLD